ncbi:RrF2 family transcriptional regulator [Botrimarina hoheduenensis]|uniref:HTH-type transcriptional regulator CymR n=1 Tax=Botrimarina hoheduenensis TaxID=2528000 RepID=A0A5C5WDW4_9BACT|nr:Rrf2 family transcriptional regulator [Botrimarina hoheduenensis]TWT48249.1 HTH-type transcriptional regulator CymR [Botrimarina hoheduenensis]
MFSAKTEYACLALLRLAVEYAGGLPLQGRRLAAEEGIPEGFLTQILQQLKRCGLVTSVRGAAGGYRLTSPPEEITVGELLEMLEGPADKPSRLATPTPLACVLTDLCDEAQQAQRAMFESVTLAELADRAAPEHAGMYYI